MIMAEMKTVETMERNGLMYIKIGDFWFPNLILKEQTEKNPTPLGRWARERQKYLIERKQPIYENMVLSETLLPHLREIDRTAEETMDKLMDRLPMEAGATEMLKAENPMKWTGIMNNCRAQAEEMIRTDLIYA